MIRDEFYESLKERTPKEHRIVKRIPWRETCFGCRSKANGGLFVRTYILEDGIIAGIAETDTQHDGYPHVTHGGVLSTYFDEVLWQQTKREDPKVNTMTIEMSVRYWHPVPENVEVKIIAYPAEIDGRHYRVHGGIILSDGTVAATASVHYLTIPRDGMISKNEYARIMHDWTDDRESIYF